MTVPGKVLLINSSFHNIYRGTALSAMLHSAPPLGPALIAGTARQAGHEVRILDLNLFPGTEKEELTRYLGEYPASVVGFSFVTPQFNQMAELAKLVKTLRPDCLLAGGGPHASSFPAQTMEQSVLDAVVTGEGELAFLALANGEDPSAIPGLVHRSNGKVTQNPRSTTPVDLDDLPFPAYDLYERDRYHVPKTIAKYSPVAWMETSRGCPYNCCYCNKSVFGSRMRFKSAQRVVDEMLHLQQIGYREVHLTDEAFTIRRERVLEMCELMRSRGVTLAWAAVTGLRVDCVDAELLRAMRAAGCYRVFFGIESGNQATLDRINKGITIEQVEQAVRWSIDAGIETWGAFMLGLPGEDEKSMEDTIQLAKRLPLDLAKVSIMIPLPGTAIFREWSEEGRIKTSDWDKFSFYTPPVEIYDHPQLTWPVIKKYYSRFYRQFYFRPTFVLRRLRRSLNNGTLLDDLKIFLKTKWA